MITPYGQPPTDHYSTDGDELSGYDWQPSRPAPAPVMPYQGVTPAVYNNPEIEARNERRSIIGRVAVALAMAIPLTAIAGGMMVGAGPLGALLGMAMAWVGIAVVVDLSHGKGFPFPRN